MIDPQVFPFVTAKLPQTWRHSVW